MGHKVMFSSDLHGNDEQYDKLVDFAVMGKADSLVIGGDIAPKGMALKYFIEGQRHFLENGLREVFERAKKERPEMKVFLMMGNDDVAVNMDVLRKFDPELFQVISGVRTRINDEFEIVGYPYVPITRARLKDWDKFDVAKYPERFRQAGIDKMAEWNLRALKTSMGMIDGKPSLKFRSGVLDPEDARNNCIELDLEENLFTERPDKTVYVMHAPPYGTNLDMANVGYHVGSVAERMFIEKHQPHVTLHGHIHETVEISGNFRERIGKTVSLAAGNNPDDERVAIVMFDLERPDCAKRVMI